MKVTGAIVFKNFLFNMRREQGIMEDLRVAAASGKKVNRPSDDPADMQRILRLRHSMTQLDQYDRNIGRGLGLLSMAETSLGDANGILQRLKEISIDGADGATPSSARIALAEEVVSLRNQLMQVANVQFDGQYVFSGTLTNQPAYTGTGTYGGNTGKLQIAVSQSSRVNITKPGSEIFGTVGGGIDVFAAINALDTALRTDDVSSIRAQIDTMETARVQVINARTELGATTNRLEGSQINMDNLRVAIREQLSNVEDADLVEVITALQAHQNTLEATIATYGTVASTSLLNFIQ
jgi:flagellar hook-associated protein 3 FlgL